MEDDLISNIFHPREIFEMSLFWLDIDKKIANYIFDPRYYISDNNHLKKIMVAFGRSKYDDFVKTCRDSFLRRLFLYYKLDDGDIYGLIQKILKKKGKIGNVHFYQCCNKFLKSLDDQISFNMLKPLNRMIVYYMSLYHGYLWISTKQVIDEGSDMLILIFMIIVKNLFSNILFFVQRK